MIRSMTGFGRASFEVAGVNFDVEARSVNHRHLDVRARMPRGLAGFEQEVKQLVQARVDRGKVDVTITAPDAGAPLQRLEIDREAARAYARAAAELKESEGLGGGVLSIDTLLGLPGVARLTDRDFPDDDLPSVLLEAVAAALDSLDAMRRAEGDALERDLRARVARVDELVEQVMARSGSVQESASREAPQARRAARRGTGPVDPARLHQEIVIAAGPSRHHRGARAAAEPRRPVRDDPRGCRAGGRSGDGSTSCCRSSVARGQHDRLEGRTTSPIAHRVVELKTEIERIREQVQNVE